MNAIVHMDTAHTLAGGAASATPVVMVLADAQPKTGLGHLGRCLAICEELDGLAGLAGEGVEGAGALGAGFVRVVPASTPAPIVLIDRAEPTGVEEVSRLQAESRRVCLLDDPGEGRVAADLVIDPPTGISWPPAGGRRLAGFEHALVRRSVRAAAACPELGVEVLLSMGGSDPEGLTPALARALRAAGCSVLSVLGPTYRGPEPEGDVLDDRGAWPRALAGARLLVGRFGHTLLEAAHLGTPAVAVATSERSGEEARAFAAHGTAHAIRVHGPADAETVAERAHALLTDPMRLAAMAARGRELVDGHGASRVAAALRELL
jgi:hypothetical protein